MTGSGAVVPSRRRRLAPVAIVLVAIAATVADTPPSPTQLKTSLGDETINVDVDHPLVSQRFVVTVPPEAAVGSQRKAVSVVLDRVSAFDPNDKPVGATEAIHLRVVEIDPSASNGRSPLPQDRRYGPTEWQLSAHASSVE